jgi:hypothetical protein
MRKSFFILVSVCLITTFYSGCGKKEGDEPTKNADQSELAKMQQQQNQLSKKTSSQHQTTTKDISDNPAFYIAGNKAGANDTTKNLDSVISPVLKKVFGDAKLIAESKSAETKLDGEVVENSITYVVKRLLVPEDGKDLHTALHNSGFGLSPRLGAQPTIWREGAIMSLFKNTPKGSYSLVVKIDTKKQQIVVESYRLGSRHDRIM